MDEPKGNSEEQEHEDQNVTNEEISQSAKDEPEVTAEVSELETEPQPAKAVRKSSGSSDGAKSSPARKASGKKRRKKRKKKVEEEEKPPTLAGKIFSVITTVLSIVMILLCVVIFVSAIANPGQNGVSIGPFRCLTVISGSMEPTIPVGSLVVISSAEESDLKVGDIVTRSAGDGRSFVTHRIIAYGEEPHQFITRGDAMTGDQSNDEPVLYTDIVGRMVFAIPMIGLLVNFSSTPMGMGLVIAAFVLFIVLVEIIKKMLRA